MREGTSASAAGECIFWGSNAASAPMPGRAEHVHNVQAAGRGDVTHVRDIWRENLAGEFGVRLKRRGRQVIASPTECCYLDFDLGVTDLEQAYSFRPIPAQVPELNSPLLFSP